MILLLWSLNVNAIDFTTSGDGKTYSVEALSALEGSGVTKEGDVFVVDGTITISEGDFFKIDEGIVVRRLPTAVPTDEWSSNNGYIGAHKRFQVFEWAEDRLWATYYI